MNKLLDKVIDFSCPNPLCKTKLKMKYSDAINRGKIKCPKCKCDIILASSSRTSLKSAINDLEKAEKKLQEAEDQIFLKAQVMNY